MYLGKKLNEKEMKELSFLISEIASIEDLTALYSKILDLFLFLFNEKKGGIMICDKELKGEVYLTSVATRGFSPEFVRKGLHQTITDESKGFASEVANKKEIIVVKNVSQYDKFIHKPEYFEEENVLSVVGIPLINKGSNETIGVVLIAITTNGELIEERKDFIEFIANFTGHSIYRIKKIQKLNEDYSKYFSLFNNATEGFYIRDAEGEIEEVNRSFLTILGLKEVEVIGKNIKAVLNVISDYGEEIKDVIKVSTPSGTKTLKISIGSIEIAKETKFFGVLRDLTEEMEYIDKLLKEDQLKDLFAQLLAQEVFDNLLGVHGYLELSYDTISKKIENEKEKEYLEKVMKKVYVLMENVEKIRKFTLLDRITKKDIQVIDVQNIVNSILTNYSLNNVHETITVIYESLEHFSSHKLIETVIENILDVPLKFHLQNKIPIVFKIQMSKFFLRQQQRLFLSFSFTTKEKSKQRIEELHQMWIKDMRVIIALQILERIDGKITYNFSDAEGKDELLLTLDLPFVLKDVW